MESQSRLLEVQKKAYEELLSAHRPDLMESAAMATDKARTIIQMTEDDSVGALQEKFMQVAAENERLRSNLKMLYGIIVDLTCRISATALDEEKMRRFYEEELRRRDQYSVQVVERVQDLVRNINSSEKFYETFSANSSQLLASLQKVAVPGVGSAAPAETELNEMKETAKRREGKLQRAKEEAKFWQTQADACGKQVAELQKRLGETQSKAQEQSDQLRATLKDSAEAEARKSGESATELRQQLSRNETETKKCMALAKMYEGQNALLKDELHRLVDTLAGLRSELADTADKQSVCRWQTKLG